MTLLLWHSFSSETYSPLDESLASPEKARPADQAIAWCTAEVRRFDPDRYFASLFAGAAGRRALVSLYAFNLEIAKIRETVSEPLLGRIRLQWWREAVEGIYAGAPRNHAVVDALAETVARHGLTRARLEAMIDGRERDLDDAPFETVDELVAYAGATSGELSCLALEALGAAGAAVPEAARSAGIAWALVGLLRAIPFHATQGRCVLPRAVIDACNVPLYDLFAGRPTANLSAAVAAVAKVATARLDAVTQAGVGKERGARPVFAPLALARGDLKRLARAGYDVFSLPAQSPTMRQWRIVAAMYGGRL